MKKYFWAFRLSLARQLAYRFNFLLGRLRNIMVLLILYYLWTALAQKTGRFAGYSREELMTYIFGVMILRAIVFGSQSRHIAKEINEGNFTNYLVKPLNHFLFFYFRELAERGLLLLSTMIEILIVGTILKIQWILQLDSRIIIFAIASVILAHFLYYIISYALSLIAFWSREAMGPRFLFEWILEFASGAYFPLTIVSGMMFSIFHSLPFIHLIFTPMSIYLGKLNQQEMLGAIILPVLWIAVAGIVARLLFKRGLKRYSGEGM